MVTHVECVANGFQDGRIVAGADNDPRGNCQAARDARDERVLTQIADDGCDHESSVVGNRCQSYQLELGRMTETATELRPR